MTAAGTGTIADLGSAWSIVGIVLVVALLGALVAREVVRLAPRDAGARMAALDVAVLSLGAAFVLVTAVRLAALL